MAFVNHVRDKMRPVGLEPTVNRVVEEVNESFRRSMHRPLRKVVIAYFNGNVTLSGTMPSFHLKQMAQVIALSHPEVRSIVNRVVVR